jgi:hypothetical protein
VLWGFLGFRGFDFWCFAHDITVTYD